MRIAIIDPIAQKESEFYFGAQVVADNIGATKEFLPGSFFGVRKEKKTYDYDMIGMTFYYPFQYFNILPFFNITGYNPYSSKRDNNAPIFFAGGPTMYNPEPIADFFDFIVIGDGEDVMKDVVNIRNATKSKAEFLEAIYNIDGVYVPSLPKKNIYTRKSAPTNRIFSKRLEIARGCKYGCKFCTLGANGKPVRFNNDVQIPNNISEINLFSPTFTTHPHAKQLCKQLIEQKVRLLTSDCNLIDADEEIFQLMADAGQARLIFGIDGISQRLRTEISKPVGHREIEKIKVAMNYFPYIKLYMISNLPQSIIADVEEFHEMMVDLLDFRDKTQNQNWDNRSNIRWVSRSRTPIQHRLEHGWIDKTKIIVNFTDFIALPGTRMENVGYQRNYIESDRLESALKDLLNNYEYLQIDWRSSEESVILQWVLARGDRRIASALEGFWCKWPKFKYRAAMPRERIYAFFDILGDNAVNDALNGSKMEHWKFINNRNRLGN